MQHPGIKFTNSIDNLAEKLKDLNKLTSLNTDEFKFNLRENLFFKDTKRTYCKCLSAPFMIEVDAKGDVYNCGPHLGDKDHCFGNILNQSFKELWASEQKKKVQYFIENEVDVNKCMPFCRPDSVNKFLWEIKNPPLHTNFI